MCSGETDTGATHWQIYGLTALYVDVDTTKCGFSSTPVYLINIVGSSKDSKWDLTGNNQVYSQTPTGFRVFVSHNGVGGTALWRLAMQYKWRVSWIAVAGKHTGTSTWGKTGWKKASKTMVFATIDCIGHGFTDTPRYFSSMHGKNLHWKVKGSHVIYSATANYFRVYVYHKDGITPQKAEQMKWGISWYGTTNPLYSGTSSSAWKAVCDIVHLLHCLPPS